MRIYMRVYTYIRIRSRKCARISRDHADTFVARAFARSRSVACACSEQRLCHTVAKNIKLILYLVWDSPSLPRSVPSVPFAAIIARY